MAFDADLSVAGTVDSSNFDAGTVDSSNFDAGTVDR